MRLGRIRNEASQLVGEGEICAGLPWSIGDIAGSIVSEGNWRGPWNRADAGKASGIQFRASLREVQTLTANPTVLNPEPLPTAPELESPH